MSSAAGRLDQRVASPRAPLLAAARTALAERGERESMAGWRTLLEDVAGRWAAEAGVDLPMPPRALATLIANAFQGAEIEILAGVSEAEAPHYEALESCAGLIERVERR